MKKIKMTPGMLFIVFCMSAVNFLNAGEVEQKNTSILTGKVTDSASGEPLEGVKVVVADLRLGAMTDKKGAYHLEISNEYHGNILEGVVFSKDGYKSLLERNVVIAPGRSQILNVSLEEKVTIRREEFKIEHRFPSVLQALNGVVKLIHVSKEKMRVTVEGTAKDIKKAHMIIRETDTPIRQVWIEVLIVKGHPEKNASSPNWPPAFEKAIQQLRKVFAFKSYSIQGRASALGLEGEVVGIDSGNTDRELGPFQIGTHITVSGETIKLKDFKLSFQRSTAGDIRTSVNTRNGRIVILGTNYDENGGGIISLVSAKFVN